MKNSKLKIFALLSVLGMSTLGCSTGNSVRLPMGGSTAPWFLAYSSKMEHAKPVQPGFSKERAALPRPTKELAALPQEDKSKLQLVHFQSSPAVAPIEKSGAPTVKHIPLKTLAPNENLQLLVDKAPGVVLIDFYADWCGPCRTQSTILHELESTAVQHKASIIKVNVDQHRELASRLQVSSLPTLMLFKDGKLVERQTGVANRENVSRLLAR